MPNELQKAYFWVERANSEFEVIEVQFNPTEITFNKGAQIAEIAIPGIDAPIQQFVRGQAEKLTLDLFFDTTDRGMDAGAKSVTTLTDNFYSLVKMQSDTHAPPICSFAWHDPSFPGANLPPAYAQQKRLLFRCIVESVSQKFTLFSPQGIPLRATLTVTLREYKALDQQLKELNLQSPEHTRAYVVQRGDTLSGIAGKLYDAPAEWRRLATENRITDPRRFAPGRVLEVAPLR
jgi:Contractile injection system tube protein/LysM domain